MTFLFSRVLIHNSNPLGQSLLAQTKVLGLKQLSALGQKPWTEIQAKLPARSRTPIKRQGVEPQEGHEPIRRPSPSNQWWPLKHQHCQPHKAPHFGVLKGLFWGNNWEFWAENLQKHSWVRIRSINSVFSLDWPDLGASDATQSSGKPSDSVASEAPWSGPSKQKHRWWIFKPMISGQSHVTPWHYPVFQAHFFCLTDSI